MTVDLLPLDAAASRLSESALHVVVMITIPEGASTLRLPDNVPRAGG